MVSRRTSTTVKAYDGEVESLTSADSSGAGVRVIRDGRQGFAHCGSLDPDVLARDARRGPQQRDVRRAGRVQRPRRARRRRVDAPRPVVRRRGRRSRPTARSSWRSTSNVGSAASTRGSPACARPSYGDGWGEIALVSTAGIEVTDRGASCSISTQPLARDGDETQTGWSVDAGRDPDALDLEHVAAEAVDRATRLLGATKPPSARMTILLEPRLAVTLLGIVSGMLSGEVVLKGRSPFVDRVGEPSPSPLLTLVDDPTRAESLGAERVRRRGAGVSREPADRRRRAPAGSCTTRTPAGGAGPRRRVRRSAAHDRSPASARSCWSMSPGDRSFDELVASIDHGLYVGFAHRAPLRRQPGVGRLLGRRRRHHDPRRRRWPSRCGS